MMKIAVFSSKSYDRETFQAANKASVVHQRFDFTFLQPHLDSGTARLAQGFDAVCVFVNDHIDRDCLDQLHGYGIKLIALRCAGFNNVDIVHATDLGMHIVRVPAYSPHAVAEHAVALILTLNRQTHRAFNRIREGNFSLNGLQGFDLNGKTIGIVGTGRIGKVIATIMHGFSCRVIAMDPEPNKACLQLGVEYVSLDQLFAQSDIITLHCPLTADNLHLINAETIRQMRDGVMLINTGRGALIETQAVINGLKSGKIGYLGLDVYEQEENLFFQDLSETIIQDDLFERLLTLPHVLVTGHQGFFTHQALNEIARITIDNICQYERGDTLTNSVTV